MPDQSLVRRFGSRFWAGRTDRRTASTMSVLRAIRAFQDSDRRMRARLVEQMKMNETDLRALRYVMMQAHRGTAVTAGALAHYLDISTAATAKLIRRLEGSGHMVTRANPQDRRSTYVEVSAHAELEVDDTLGTVHQEMYKLINRLGDEERAVVERTLTGLIAIMDASLPEQEPARRDAAAESSLTEDSGAA